MTPAKRFVNEQVVPRRKLLKRVRLIISVVGQNLVKDRHVEFIDDPNSSRSTLMKRSVYAKFTNNFNSKEEARG
jgi:hypothetical protein